MRSGMPERAMRANGPAAQIRRWMYDKIIIISVSCILLYARYKKLLLLLSKCPRLVSPAIGESHERHRLSHRSDRHRQADQRALEDFSSDAVPDLDQLY